MLASHFDVVIVGGGCAGMTAGIGLAKNGFSVAVVEAAAYPGAENWSGCVYFCENLAHPDILGPAGVEGLAWERRLVERGFFGCDGHGLAGMSYRDPQAFRDCYTVLRPIFDNHLAQLAAKAGVVILNDTTAESLIRDQGRVVGVCTQRGALYADLVFLAEGDASQLVTREGYERYPDQREGPKFLQGIKQVIELPAGVIEEVFRVGDDEGVAYELLLRNGRLGGHDVRLNMGGFLYTNKTSLSIGLVLPADHLRDHFGGDPNLLIDWFEKLPALQPWLKQGTRGVFGAKLIRGGGARDIPRLVDDGLAIGGAASALGIDFPYPNFTGPATYMGLVLVHAARRIRADKGRFSQEKLTEYYLKPLEGSHYWHDVEYLRRWPAYVKRTTVFFGKGLELALGSAYIWSRPNKWFPAKWLNWMRLGWSAAGPEQWTLLRGDLRHLQRALRLAELVGRPSVWRLLLDGTLNALRDLAGTPRPHLPAAGQVRVHYSVAGETAPPALPPVFRRWFRRFLPVLASAARRVYSNSTEPLPDKLRGAVGLLVRQINIVDVAAGIFLGVATMSGSGLLAGCSALGRRLRGRATRPGGLYPRYARAVAQAADLTPLLAGAAGSWEGRLGQLAYQTVKETHIAVLWPRSLPGRKKVVQHGLWHVCPAHVYEARVNSQGELQLVVNFENCIKCETCWRTTDLVDWGRDGQHRFIYPVHSPAVGRLLADAYRAVLTRPAKPRALDAWEPALRALLERFHQEQATAGDGHHVGELLELLALLQRLERKLEEFDEALGEEPRTIDKARAAYLEMLARYAGQLGLAFLEQLTNGPLADAPRVRIALEHSPLLRLANELVKKAEERGRRLADSRYRWAAADGRQLRHHHIAGLRRILQVLIPRRQDRSGERGSPDVGAPRWLQAEHDASTVARKRADWAARLDGVFSPSSWRDLERQKPLTGPQDAVLRELLALVPAIDPNHLGRTLHPPLRKALLAELGRRDPALAYRAACHLWARDLARLAGASSGGLARVGQQWARAEEWASFAIVDGVQTSGAGWQGEALFVPALGVRQLLLLVGDQLALVPSAGRPGLQLEPLPTLGLRGAGLARLRLDNLVLPDDRVVVDHARILRAWHIVSAADLTSIACGIADLLTARAIGHAANRVQFPGLFYDEEARDSIGKFGAVKKMLAEMGARRLLIETLDHVLTPVDFSAVSAEQAGLVKVLVAEALGTAPGSLAYNAGQVLGGTGFSEDDVFAKFYRDAAAWRFLGQTNSDVLGRHGEELLRSWRPDGQQLANLPGEAEQFEQLAQRKALQGELDAIRVFRSQLRGLINEWLAAGGSTLAAAARPPAAAETRFTFTSRAVAEVGEGLARQEAYLLAGKTMLLRLHARLERGLTSETELALLRVWLDQAAGALEDFENSLRLHFAQAVGRHEGLATVVGARLGSYSEYLASACPYDSGDFLEKPVDLERPRFVPEMIGTDPALARRNAELEGLIAGYFGRPRANGLSYERYVEQQHRPDPEDLDYCRRHGFFRMPIPAELGGAGRSKLDYYLLTTACQRLADVAISLTIQVNSSLGTTPVLLARDQELPRAQKDVAYFAAETELHTFMSKRLENLLARLETADLSATTKATEEIQARLQATIGPSAALKALAHGFLEAWGQAGLAAAGFGRQAVRHGLQEALANWRQCCSRAGEYLHELDRRRQAAELFLRWVAAGQIAAFALTEPSAGSDTARVATRAVLRSVGVEREPDGALRFCPSGGQEPRYLLDARKLEFKSDGGACRACYRWSPTAEPAEICFDEYDYETDDPRGRRYYRHGSRKLPFTDIALLRERDGQFFYDYWELTGAKMWITNGRMAGVMCLYARTDEGITGFMVDRHAEGLVVGKDEEKLGQCGSPTNELALQAVRVPRENIIGIEGRGQVNALETLNVGRAGLAMSAMAQLEGLIELSRAFAQANHREIPDWIDWRLQRMEEERFIAEALAHEVIGRFEHPQTKSVRMESAIAKALVSESLHRVIELAEEIHGLPGQTRLHLVEKRKRDARVLTIYEGTNEIQRFFILKDIAAAWGAPQPAKDRDARPTQASNPEAAELEAIRQAVCRRIAAAVQSFGQDLWQNPNLQANCFVLAEAVAWLKAADSALYRFVWLATRREPPGTTNANEPAVPAAPWLEAIARRAWTRCTFEVRMRLQRFDEELSRLRRGFYGEEIRAATLLFRQARRPPEVVSLKSRISRPLSVLVILEPGPAPLPQHLIRDGKVLQSYWTLSPADRSALEAALRLRDEAPQAVTIQTVTVGPRSAAPALREALNLGIHRVRLILTESDAVAPDSAAAVLSAALVGGGPYDLILGGCGKADEQDGLVARLTASALDIPDAGSAPRLAVHSSDEGSELLLGIGPRSRRRPLPAAVGIEPELVLRSFSTDGFLAGLARSIEIERWPRRFEGRAVAFAQGGPGEAPSPDAGVPLQPADAASRLLKEIGLPSSRAAAGTPFTGSIADVAEATLLSGRAAAVIAAVDDGGLQPVASLVVRAARLLADLPGLETTVLLLATPDEQAQRRALAQLRSFFRGDVLLLITDQEARGLDIQARFLAECWPGGLAQPRLLLGEPWTEPALVTLGSRELGTAIIAPRIRRLIFEPEQTILETGRAQSKLRWRQLLPAETDKTSWLALAADAEITDTRTAGPARQRPFRAGALHDGRVARWQPACDHLFSQPAIQRLLAEALHEIGAATLADAEVIIDVGFGVGNRDGYEAVIEPLEKAVHKVGVRGLMIGGSRKVTEELHLLPADRQIGQSGVSVNPRILLAIGISGAPQHLNYIGPRATVIAFNRDPEAPLLTLNRRQPRPRVFPVIGDLFETVPAFIAALRQGQTAQAPARTEEKVP